MALKKEMDKVAERELENDFDILCQIYEDTVINNDVAYFSKLVKETGYSSKIVGKNLEKLSDLCMIYIEFKKVKGESFACFYIDDDTLPLAESLYKNSEKVEESANMPR